MWFFKSKNNNELSPLLKSEKDYLNETSVIILNHIFKDYFKKLIQNLQKDKSIISNGLSVNQEEKEITILTGINFEPLPEFNFEESILKLKQERISLTQAEVEHAKTLFLRLINIINDIFNYNEKSVYQLNKIEKTVCTIGFFTPILTLLFYGVHGFEKFLSNLIEPETAKQYSFFGSIVGFTGGLIIGAFVAYANVLAYQQKHNQQRINNILEIKKKYHCVINSLINLLKLIPAATISVGAFHFLFKALDEWDVYIEVDLPVSISTFLAFISFAYSTRGNHAVIVKIMKQMLYYNYSRKLNYHIEKLFSNKKMYSSISYRYSLYNKIISLIERIRYQGSENEINQIYKNIKKTSFHLFSAQEISEKNASVIQFTIILKTVFEMSQLDSPNKLIFTDSMLLIAASIICGAGNAYYFNAANELFEHYIPDINENISNSFGIYLSGGNAVIGLSATHDIIQYSLMKGSNPRFRNILFFLTFVSSLVAANTFAQALTQANEINFGVLFCLVCTFIVTLTNSIFGLKGLLFQEAKSSEYHANSLRKRNAIIYSLESLLGLIHKFELPMLQILDSFIAFDIKTESSNILFSNIKEQGFFKETSLKVDPIKIQSSINNKKMLKL